jgi:hypothetical protein
MKLYVDSKSKNKKIYLAVYADSRFDLAKLLGSTNFNLGDNETFHVNDVIAESEIPVNAPIGALVGGVVGILGGPVGILIGASLGGILANSTSMSEDKNVNLFNNVLVK